jgi:hypothetical protein
MVLPAGVVELSVNCTLSVRVPEDGLTVKDAVGSAFTVTVPDA